MRKEARKEKTWEGNKIFYEYVSNSNVRKRKLGERIGQLNRGIEGKEVS